MPGPDVSKIARAIAPLALLILFAGGAAAAPDEDLYRGKTVVTGTGEPNRLVGFARTLEDVLVKVSGDPRLIGRPEVAALGRRAGEFVGKFDYRDLMAGKPIRDEQGTRDRPHELTVTFDPAKIGAALETLGRRPWTDTRPRVVVFLGVRNGSVTYMLAKDGERGSDQRESLAASAWRVGIPIVLPDQAAADKAGLSPDKLPAADLARLEDAARAMGGDLALAGTLTWSDAARGWIAEWRIAAKGKIYRWRVRGVNFDEAFRNAMRGSLQALSGNGQPK